MVQLPPIPPELVWALPLLYLLWEIHAPKYFGVDTRFEQIVNGFNTRIDNVGQRIDELESRQRDHIRITEIIAVQADDINGSKVKDTLSEEDELSKEEFVYHDPYVKTENENAHDD